MSFQTIKFIFWIGSMKLWNNQTINQFNNYYIFTSMIRKITLTPKWWRLRLFLEQLERVPKSSVFAKTFFTYFWWRLPTFSDNLRSPKSSLFGEKKIVRTYLFMTCFHFFEQLEVSEVESFRRKIIVCTYFSMTPFFKQLEVSEVESFRQNIFYVFLMTSSHFFEQLETSKVEWGVVILYPLILY